MSGKQEVWLTIACAGFLVLGIISNTTGLIPASFAVPFYILSYITGGYTGVVEVITHLKKLKLNIDFLMIAAAIGAAVLDEWIEGAILLFLFSLSGALESYALDKSRNAIHSLLELRPSKGLRRNSDGTETEISVEKLEIGDILIVKPGEHIPIDGKIVKGKTTVDQATITGESIPVAKETGNSVFAATLNENGVIEIEVTKTAKDTTVSKIIELVKKAQENKAVTQRFLDTFEPRYAITVIVFVALLIVVPWLILGQDFDSVFYRAMTVLVVASPCALIISTPASIISAIANGAKNGILFKGGAYVEQTVEIDTIAFDKTGTLTIGKPVVAAMFFYDDEKKQFLSKGETTDQLLALAAGCERYSEHHLAEAIVLHAKEKNIKPYDIQNMQATPGQGVTAVWNGTNVAVGNHMLFKDIADGWPKAIHQKASELKKQGNTVVFVVKEDFPVGLLALADQVRPEAKAAIKSLKELGVKHIAMLTGDNKEVAQSIATELNIDDIHAELLPNQKVEVIEKMKQNGTVAMIGDGVNDAPALATSHLGVAMGAAGTDVALETADIVLMGDDFSKLPYLLSLSRKAKRVVWQNIWFSLTVIVVLLLGVFMIDLPLTLGVIGHEGSTLLVVLNGLRLLGNKNMVN